MHSVPASLQASTTAWARAADLAGLGVLAEGGSDCCMPSLARENRVWRVGSSEPWIFGCVGDTAEALHFEKSTQPPWLTGLLR